MAEVTLRSVRKVYPNGHVAIDDASFVIRDGELLVLVGPSGCGKSTLLRLIAGLVAPSAGAITQSHDDGAPRRLAFVFQHPTLMPWGSVARNVRLPLDLAGVARSEADRRVRAALELVGLGEFARVYPRELSGGMQMRASIARALVTAPRSALLAGPA